jgi:hypothetical protein
MNILWFVMLSVAKHLEKRSKASGTHSEVSGSVEKQLERSVWERSKASVLVVTLEPVESPRAAGAPMLVALARCLRIACYEYGGWRNVDGNGCSESIALPRQILPSIRRTIM